MDGLGIKLLGSWAECVSGLKQVKGVSRRKKDRRAGGWAELEGGLRDTLGWEEGWRGG